MRFHEGTPTAWPGESLGFEKKVKVGEKQTLGEAKKPGVLFLGIGLLTWRGGKSIRIVMGVGH